MPQVQDPASGINSWLEEELFHQYQFDRGSVDRGWVDLFNQGAGPSPAKQDGKAVGASDQLIPLRGVAARIVENMTASLSIPTATSQRQVPVRIVEENRNLINKQRALQGKSKLSFTHLIAWAIVRAL